MKFDGEYTSSGRTTGVKRFRLECKVEHRGLCFIISFPYSALIFLC